MPRAVVPDLRGDIELEHVTHRDLRAIDARGSRAEAFEPSIVAPVSAHANLAEPQGD